MFIGSNTFFIWFGSFSLKLVIPFFKIYKVFRLDVHRWSLSINEPSSAIIFLESIEDTKFVNLILLISVAPSRELDVTATLPGRGNWCRGLCFVKKRSRHIVLWSLENLTGVSEILRQWTGCVNRRY